VDREDKSDIGGLRLQTGVEPLLKDQIRRDSAAWWDAVVPMRVPKIAPTPMPTAVGMGPYSKRMLMASTLRLTVDDGLLGRMVLLQGLGTSLPKRREKCKSGCCFPSVHYFAK